MRSIILWVLVAALCATGCSSGRKMNADSPIDIDTSPGGPRYLQSGRGLDRSHMAEQLEKEPEAALYVSTSWRLRVFSGILAGAGGAMVGLPVGQELGGDPEPLWPLAAAGAGVTAVAITLAILGVYSMDKAVKAHNATLEHQADTSPASPASLPWFATGKQPTRGAGFALGGDVAAAQALHGSRLCVGEGQRH